MSWRYDQRTVSVWTTAGRLKNVGFACAPEALKMLVEHRQGDSDLVERGGVFYLMATCEVAEAEQYSPEGFIGVDLGIANIATTSTGYRAAGRGLNRHRKRQAALRAELQAKKTTSAKRRLKTRRRREARHVANTNHVIAKQIVTEAERTSAGIALEDLTGICDAVAHGSGVRPAPRHRRAGRVDLRRGRLCHPARFQPRFPTCQRNTPGRVPFSAPNVMTGNT
ncbi:hypothetical protein [Streptomonospora litoralis]|uniref:Putative transposase n=1 Tax=Streptomonospora litoralis TaxID=2498135 RepID=A0A4P6QAA4_9ACTN|nr:putative transposase [Streptomonospora litoralis]